MRRQWEEWLRKDDDFKARTTGQLDEIAEAARLTTEKIRAHLLQTAGETHRRELAEAEAVKDWKERQRLRESADNAHAVRVSRIEELASSFAEIEGRGTATSVFQEMTRILTEQGVDEATAYVSTQRSSILTTVRARAAGAHARNRADLQPLVMTAGMYETKGQFAEAYGLYSEILAIEPNWVKPRDDLASLLIQWGRFIEPKPGNEKLKEAVEICRETIALNPKDKIPQDWAKTQNNLGNALRVQGERKKCIDLLTEAKAAFQSSQLSYKEAGYSQCDGYLETRLEQIDRLIKDLSSADRMLP